MAMIALARIVLVMLLLGPQLGAVALPSEVVCQETDDCCEPDGGCDVNCIRCACCASRTPTLTPASRLVLAALPGSYAPAGAAAPSQPAPRDILHVPKSV